MNYATALAKLLSSRNDLASDTHHHVTQRVLRLAEQLVRLILAFLTQPITPTTTMDFEQQLAVQLRELGRELMQWTLNTIEGSDPHALPQQLDYEGERYRILAQKN
jgi:methionyl-tRNA synthetase